ncbi:MAG: hypothetical protein WB507_11935 [Solirubrobacterales bacterium]
MFAHKGPRHRCQPSRSALAFGGLHGGEPDPGLINFREHYSVALVRDGIELK